MAGQIPEALKTEFHTRCMAVVNRGIGEIAIAPDVTVEARLPSLSTDCWHAGLDRSTTIAGPEGRLSILHVDLTLNEKYEFVKHTESEHIGVHERPTIASEDVIKGYMYEDLGVLFTPPGELGASLLLKYLGEMDRAEKLGLYDVGIDDVLDAINVMDGLVRAYDSSQG